MKKLITQRKNGTRRVQSVCEGKTLTKQSFKDECNVNNILEKHKNTNVLKVNKQKGEYGDFSNSIDYSDALNLVINANEQFESLPAAIRKQFNNDPVEFLSFCSDEKNYPKMIEMGLKQGEAGLSTQTPTVVETPLKTKTETSQEQTKETK